MFSRAIMNDVTRVTSAWNASGDRRGRFMPGRLAQTMVTRFRRPRACPASDSFHLERGDVAIRLAERHPDQVDGLAQVAVLFRVADRNIAAFEVESI